MFVFPLSPAATSDRGGRGKEYLLTISKYHSLPDRHSLTVRQMPNKKVYPCRQKGATDTISELYKIKMCGLAKGPDVEPYCM